MRPAVGVTAKQPAVGVGPRPRRPLQDSGPTAVWSPQGLRVSRLDGRRLEGLAQACATTKPPGQTGTYLAGTRQSCLGINKDPGSLRHKRLAVRSATRPAGQQASRSSACQPNSAMLLLVRLCSWAGSGIFSQMESRNSRTVVQPAALDVLTYPGPPSVHRSLAMVYHNGVVSRYTTMDGSANLHVVQFL